MILYKLCDVIHTKRYKNVYINKTGLYFTQTAGKTTTNAKGQQQQKAVKQKEKTHTSLCQVSPNKNRKHVHIHIQETSGCT